MNKYQIEIKAKDHLGLHSALTHLLSKVRKNLNYSKEEMLSFEYEFVNVTGSLIHLDMISSESIELATIPVSMEIIDNKECLIIQSKMNYEESDL